MKVIEISGNDKRLGFTLTEIMIVVAIIGLLSVIAVPSYLRARETSQLTALQNDLRIYVDAFQTYFLENNAYPPDNVPGAFPAEMDGYIKSVVWLEGPPCGGRYEWHYCGGYSEFMIAIHNCANSTVMMQFDERVDDGNLNTGLFIGNGGIYYWRFEQ